VWLEQQSTCFASAKPRVQSPVPPKRKKSRKKVTVAENPGCRSSRKSINLKFFFSILSGHHGWNDQGNRKPAVSGSISQPRLGITTINFPRKLLAPSSKTKSSKNVNLKHLLFFGGSGVWTHGFMVTMQVFCCLSHTSSPKASFFGYERLMDLFFNSQFFIILLLCWGHTVTFTDILTIYQLQSPLTTLLYPSFLE
jgi:hypothetical protein